MEPRRSIKMSQKSAVISIIGKPNAGKSTLLNKLIGQKISIVTPKVQTTRNIINGILTEGDTQLVFLDTPGLFIPKNNLERIMVRYAWSSMSGADLVILLLDSTDDLDPQMIKHINQVIQRDIKLIFVLNKQDHVKQRISSLTDLIQRNWPAYPILTISALHNLGISALKAYLKNLAPEHPFFYDEEEITTLPMRFMASEITREKLFLYLRQELPYKLTVETDIFERQPDQSWKIHQTILVTSDSHKSIILGHQGKMIKHIGTKARLSMIANMELKVHLFLFVKVREQWLNNPERFI